MSARDEYADFRDGFITDDKIADDVVTTYEITDAGLEALVDLLDRLDDEAQAHTIANTRMGRELVNAARHLRQRCSTYAWQRLIRPHVPPAWRSVLDQEEG